MIGPDGPSDSDIYSLSDLWRCYRACRRTKRNTFNALAFEVDAEAKLLQLQHELRAATYRPGRLTTLAKAPRFQAQYALLTRRAGETLLVFCPVGRYIEFRGRQRLLAETALQLRRTYLPRAGFAFVAGFPASLAERYAARALKQGLGVVTVDQRPGTDGRWRRVPVAIRLPAGGVLGTAPASTVDLALT
jgi:hypothetical protein